MSNNVYILRENKDSGELHLFLASKTQEDTCRSQEKSICGKMDIEDDSKTIFACQPEKSARKQCAKIGKSVCSRCVGYLYDDGLQG